MHWPFVSGNGGKMSSEDDTHKIQKIHDALIGTIDKPGGIMSELNDMGKKIKSLEEKFDAFQETSISNGKSQRKHFWTTVSTVSVALISMIGSIAVLVFK